MDSDENVVEWLVARELSEDLSALQPPRTLLLYRSEQTFVKPVTKKRRGGQTTAPFPAYIKLQVRHGMCFNGFTNVSRIDRKEALEDLWQHTETLCECLLRWRC